MVLTSLLIASLARETLSFMGGRCQAPGWLSPSCPHDRLHLQPGKGRKKPFANIPWGRLLLEGSWGGWRRSP